MPEEKPKIAILTSLCDFSPAYSLVGIILDQARMLKRHGYDYRILCLKNFNKRDRELVEKEGLAVDYTLAQVILHCYGQNERPKETGPDPKREDVTLLGFKDQVQVLLNGDKSGIGYIEALKPFDVILTHDLMFLDWYLVNNEAIRYCIDTYPDKRWIHWVHSGPCIRPTENEKNPRPNEMCYPTTLRFSAAPNSIYAFLNHGARQDYANMIGTDNSVIRVVFNPKDVRVVYGFLPQTRALIDRYNLMDHQILQIYPISTPRFGPKGVRHLLEIWKNWKAMGIRARLVIVNGHCNRDVNKPQIAEMEAMVRSCGLILDDDVVFTSRFSDEMKERTEGEEQRDWKLWRYSVPARVVQELMLLSNMFVFPSSAECCSLIQAEASISGCFMVLNRNFPPMLEFVTENCLHYQMTQDGNEPDRNPVFWAAVAREIWANAQNCPVFMNTTRARTTIYNPDWIFQHQLEPLLFSGHADRVSASGRRPERPAPPKPVLVKKASAPKEKKEKDWENPWDGMECPIFGTCAPECRRRCYEQADHCLMLDETPPKKEEE